MAITPVGYGAAWPSGAAESGLGIKQAVDQPGGGASFDNVINGLLERANEPHVQADQAFEGLVTGETDNVHDVVMSVVKADLSFRFVLELRNRLTEAYQEIMRMQV